MPRRTPPNRVQVPERSPRSSQREAYRTVESDGEWSTTRAEFDLDSLSDTASEADSELAQSGSVRPYSDFSIRANGDETAVTRSAFLRIMERTQNTDPDITDLFSDDENDQWEYTPRLVQHPVGRRVSLSSPVTDRYRSNKRPMWRSLAALPLFILMAFLQFGDKSYFSSINAFNYIYYITGATLVADMVLDMPDYPETVQRRSRRRPTSKLDGLFIAFLVFGYLSVFIMAYIRLASLYK